MKTGDKPCSSVMQIKKSPERDKSVGLCVGDLLLWLADHSRCVHLVMHIEHGNDKKEGHDSRYADRVEGVHGSKFGGSFSLPSR